MLQTYTHFNIKEMLRDFDIKRKKTRKKQQYQTTVVKIFKLMTKTFSQKNHKCQFIMVCTLKDLANK